MAKNSNLFEPWAGASASLEICPCCGIHFGYDDYAGGAADARLRGEFIRKAQEKRRDFTVDWVHLKLNDQAQRTVLCKDPFKSVDERVDKLIASM